MKQKAFRKLRTFLVTMLLFLITVPVLAQSGGGYDLTWNSIDGGGGVISTGGDYTLSGTIGQHDAGQFAGGDYSLVGGFWSGGGAAPPPPLNQVFLPLVTR